MTTGLRIAEVARRSGFTPATLRYYEEVGLVPPPVRTVAGYRIYDERTLERLAFIARAKQLGCSLEEIAELTVAWDGGLCGPVRDRLSTLVAAKLADAQTRILELMTFSAELQAAAAALERHRPEGPCDDRCGCTTAPEPVSTVVTLAAKPSVEETPIACTLSADSMPGRMDDWQRLLGFVTARSSVDAGVRLTLAAEAPVEEVARLAAAEQDCCRFFSFVLTIDHRGTGLEVRAPADAVPVVHALFGVPA